MESLKLSFLTNKQENTMDLHLTTNIPSRIVRVRFEGNTADYSYALPDYITDEELSKATHAVVVNASSTGYAVTVISGQTTFAEDPYTGEYKYAVAVFSDAGYADVVEESRRRRRIVEALKRERKRLADSMDFTELAKLSPEAAKLIEELKGPK